MPASGTFVIAGGGLASAKTAEALREQGFDGRIVLAAEEDHPPLRTAAAVQGLPAGQDQPRGNLRARPGLVRRQRGRAAASHGGHRDRPGPPGGDAVRRRAPGLRQAAAGHRIGPAPPAAARRGRRRRAVPAPAPTATGSGTPSPPRPAYHHRRRLDRPGGSGCRPRRRGDVTILEAAELPLLHVLGPRSRRYSPACTASTASTCGSASGSPR